MIRFEQDEDGAITLIADAAGVAELDGMHFGQDAYGWNEAASADTIAPGDVVRYALPDGNMERDLILDALVAVDREAAAALEALLQ